MYSRLLVLVLLALLAGCTVNFQALQLPRRSIAVLTGGPWASMIYLARVEDGVIAIDLGMDGDGHALAAALEELGAGPEEVVAVFLTHSHRDHIAAWRAVRHARFYLAARELARLTGREEHRGFIPRWVDRLVEPDLPGLEELDVRPFARDTMVVFGADTLRIFPVPGHTPGSAAYLFRGILFAGDAVSWTPVFGFRGTKPIYSDDAARSQASLAALWARLGPFEVRYVCTAHGKCAAADSTFIRAVLH